VITSPGRIPDEKEIYNLRLRAINHALECDRLLTNRIKISPLALNTEPATQVDELGMLLQTK
jgi:hypothetical protein